jgi:hypothetical protein
MDVKALSNASAVAKKVFDAASIAGWNPKNIVVVETQFIQEKGWEYWSSYPDVTDFNFANTKIGLPITSEVTGIIAYLATIFNGNPHEFMIFSDALRGADPLHAITVLSQLDWAVPPYGQTIIDLFDEIVGKHTTLANYITVQPGDSLWSIAERWGIGLRGLQLLNPDITPPYTIVPGQEVRIRA